MTTEPAAGDEARLVPVWAWHLLCIGIPKSIIIKYYYALVIPHHLKTNAHVYFKHRLWVKGHRLLCVQWHVVTGVPRTCMTWEDGRWSWSGKPRLYVQRFAGRQIPTTGSSKEKEENSPRADLTKEEVAAPHWRRLQAKAPTFKGWVVKRLHLKK